MMRTAVAGMLVLGAALALASTASADPGERITSYDISVTIAADGNAHVTETIGYDFGTGQRHGITRTLPGRRLVGQASVASPDGAPVATTTTGNVIRVGDPNTTVTGTHTYVLNYDLRDTLTPQGSVAAMVWNVVDGSWDVPITAVTETIKVPATPTLGSCLESGSRCNGATITADGDVIHVHKDNVTPHQIIAVKAALPSAGLKLATLPTVSATYSDYPTTSWNQASSSSASSSESSSRSTAAFGWLFGLALVALIVGVIAKAARGSGGSRGSSSYYDSGYSSYSSSSSSDSGSSSSSWSDSSSSSSSDSGSSSSSSSSCGSGSW